MSSSVPVQLPHIWDTTPITGSSPFIAIGDSHSDNATSAHFFFDRLKNVRNQPGEGLENVKDVDIIPLGNNGQTLLDYLAGGGPNTLADAMALNPSVVLACWLTNDVRLGGLGLNVNDIRANGASRLVDLVKIIKTSVPDAMIVLRIPAPYLTINVGGLNYITDGVNVNPPGLAQVYTSGVRAAHYAVLETYPDVIIFDPQLLLFGIESPTSVGTDYADQIHENQTGYEKEADTLGTWFGAWVPYDQAATDVALMAQPYTPWLSYYRAVEDYNRFIQIAYADAVTVTAGNTFLDFGPSEPNAIPSLIDRYDIIETVGAKRSFVIPQGSTISASATNTRVSLAGGATVPASAVAKTRVRVFRQSVSGDSNVNSILAKPFPLFRRTGRISAGGTTFMDITAYSLTNVKPSQPANQWVPLMQAGDKIYIEGFGSTPITLTNNFAQSGGNLRITGLTGTNWGLFVGRIAVVYRDRP